MFYRFGEQLEELEDVSRKREGEALLAVFNKEEWVSAMDRIGFEYDWDICYSPVSCTKLECQPSYLLGTFCIPKILDHSERKRELLFFINQEYVVIVDQEGFAAQMIKNLQQEQKEGKYKTETAEKFLYYFLLQLLNDGNHVLEEYEQQIIAMEEKIMLNPVENFHGKLMPVRRNLLEMECYYDQMADVLKELRENENGYFAKEKLHYFRTLTERAERMERKAAKLLEQSKHIRDVYQAQMESRQNDNMQFLTIVSTVFAPLTLLTGWYGMNFKNMPELEKGYPWVFVGVTVIIVICILVFKKKKMF